MALADLVPGDTVLRVATTWSEKELMRQIPGVRAVAKDPGALIGQQIWTLPLTWASCVTLRGVFREQLQLGDEVVRWAEEHLETVVKPALTLRGMTEWHETWTRDPAGPESDDRLFSFQQVGAHFLLRSDGIILGDDMGLGKTVQILVALLYFLQDAGFPVCVVCPNSVKAHWARLLKIWCPFANPYVVTGGAVQRRKILKEAQADPNALVIINFEAVRLVSRLAPYGSVRLKKCIECDPHHGDPELKVARCEVHHKELNEFGFKTVVVDELHRCGDPSSKQTRAIWGVTHAANVRWRWGTTGTLFDRPEQLWSLLHTIAPKEFPTKTTFVDRYMLWSWNQIGQPTIIGFHPDHRQELYSILDPHYRRMPKALVAPQLPPKMRSVRVAGMTRDQARMYHDLEKSNITTTPNGIVWAIPHDLAVRTRLMQLATSGLEITDQPDPDDVSTWKVSVTKPIPKLDLLDEVVDELGTAPFAVASPSRQVITIVQEHLQERGVRTSMIAGGVSLPDRERALDDLREGKIQCIAFVMAAGGEGLDMSAAGTLIRFSRADSLRLNRQSEDRPHRFGAEHHEKINIIDFVTEGTKEVDQVELLNSKLVELEVINRDKAKLLAAGFNERHPDVVALEQIASQIEAIDLQQALLGLEIKKEGTP